MDIHLCFPKTARSPRLPQPFLCLGERPAEQRSSLPPHTTTTSTCTQFPGHLDSSSLTAGPRSTFSGASTLPSSYTDPQAYSRCGEWRRRQRQRRTPSGLEVRRRLREEQSLSSNPQKDHSDVQLDAKEQQIIQSTCQRCKAGTIIHHP